MFIENYTKEWLWFPITYIYDRVEYGNSLFRQFAIRLKSKEYLQEVVKIMGFSDAEAFRKKYIEIEKKWKKEILENIDITVRLKRHRLYVNMLNQKNWELGISKKFW